MIRKILGLSVFLSSLAFALNGFAQLQLPALFSDNMVLQQGMPVTIWGWGEDGDKVTVKFRGQAVSATTHNSTWSLELRPLKASSAPADLVISTPEQTVTLANVLVGEVWVCSGQSNMEWPLRSSFEADVDIASATNQIIRLFHVPKNKMDAPTTRIKASWQVCSPDQAKGFSAVGYYFARSLQAARNVPVGMIESDWGGSPAEAWMSQEALEINPRYQTEILDPYPAALKNYQTALAAYEKEKAEAKEAGREFKKNAPWPGWRPGELYNGMIAPLIPYAIKGAIWYQGESNAGRAEQYRSLFADMIRCWRRDWDQPDDFTFLCVQLAPWDKNKKRTLEQITEQPGDSDWAELREAQWLATKTLPKVGMAVITDLGDKDDIHPTKKGPVGERLALAARGIAYGESIEFSGPLYRSCQIKGDKIVLHFDHLGKGLEARGGALKGFAICGEDRNFVWANAEIVGKTVVVSCPSVPKPVAVRYGWSDNPVVNLWNKDGLPASPFRTDDFPMVTAPKK